MVPLDLKVFKVTRVLLDLKVRFKVTRVLLVPLDLKVAPR